MQQFDHIDIKCQVNKKYKGSHSSNCLAMLSDLCITVAVVIHAYNYL